jgi:hypothetical protein
VEGISGDLNGVISRIVYRETEKSYEEARWQCENSAAHGLDYERQYLSELWYPLTGQKFADVSEKLTVSIVEAFKLKDPSETSPLPNSALSRQRYITSQDSECFCRDGKQASHKAENQTNKQIEGKEWLSESEAVCVPAPRRDTESRSRDVWPYQATRYLYCINETQGSSFSSSGVAARGRIGRVTYSRWSVSAEWLTDTRVHWTIQRGLQTLVLTEHYRVAYRHSCLLNNTERLTDTRVHWTLQSGLQKLLFTEQYRETYRHSC